MNSRLPRDAAMHAVLAAWGQGVSVVISGPPGMGKSTLVRRLAEHLGRHTFVVAGSAPMRTTPLAAVAAAVRVKPADDVSTIVRRLAQAADERDAVPVVEAADELDPGSAAVVAKLVVRGGPVLLTRRTGNGCAFDPVLASALAHAGAITVELQPLDQCGAADLAVELLGGPLDGASLIRLHRVTGGNPMYLRLLVEGLKQSGALADGPDGSWRLSGDLPISDELQHTVWEELQQASPQCRQLLGFLGLAAALSADVVEQLGLSGALDDDGLVEVRDGQVSARQPIYAEVAASRLGTLERRAITAELVAVLVENGRSPERLHGARLALDAAIEVPLAILAEAGEVAFLLGDLRLAERLAEVAVDKGAGLTTLLQLARTRSSMGRSTAAADALARVDADALASEADVTAYAVAAALNCSVAAHDREAIALLDHLETRVSTPDLRAAFDALRALAFVNAGDQYEAVRRARALTSAVDPGFVAATAVWRSIGFVVEAEALRRLGEVSRPQALARHALVGTSRMPLVGTGARRTLVHALLADGKVEGARMEADRLLEITLMDAVGGGTRAFVSAAQGRFSEVIRTLSEQEVGRDDLGERTVSLLAAAYAVLGDADSAWRTHHALATAVPSRRPDSSVSLSLSKRDRSVPDRLLTEAFARMSEGQIVAPRALVRNAVAAALAADQVSEAVSTSYWSVRMGDRKGMAEFLTAASACEGQLVRLQERHARGLRARDAEELICVSETFAHLGYVPFAADALAQAVAAVRDDENLLPTRRQDAIAQLTDRLSELRDQCERLLTPAIRDAESAVALTPRELGSVTKVAGDVAVCRRA